MATAMILDVVKRTNTAHAQAGDVDPVRIKLVSRLSKLDEILSYACPRITGLVALEATKR